jgi:hypothetical protein
MNESLNLEPLGVFSTNSKEWLLHLGQVEVAMVLS